MARLRPVVLRVTLDSGVGSRAGSASEQHLAVLGHAAHVDRRCAVRGGSGELHHDGRVVGTLEVGKIPPRRRVVGLHALQSVDEEGLALEVDGALLGGDGALGDASRPERMPHRAPRVLQVGTEEGLARGADLEAGGCSGHLEVDDGSLVVHALDGVKGAIFRKLDGAVVGIKGRLVLAEVDVVEWRGAPEVLLGLVRGEDLAVELTSGSDAAV